MSSIRFSTGVPNSTSHTQTINQGSTDGATELVNSVIHGIGILFGLVAIPLLVATAIKFHSVPITVSTVVYGLSFLMLFTFSTMYHAFRHPNKKNVLEVLDHVSIYFFIAGTYTPIIIKFMNNSTGIRLLYLLWILVFVGSTFKICFGCRYNILSTIVYVIMGWMLLFTGKSFFKEMPQNIIALIVTGGILYSIGVVFFLYKKLKWGHGIWHALVVSAAICHYFAIYNSFLQQAI